MTFGQIKKILIKYLLFMKSNAVDVEFIAGRLVAADSDLPSSFRKSCKLIKAARLAVSFERYPAVMIGRK